MLKNSIHFAKICLKYSDNICFFGQIESIRICIKKVESTRSKIIKKTYGWFLLELRIWIIRLRLDEYRNCSTEGQKLLSKRSKSYLSKIVLSRYFKCKQFNGFGHKTDCEIHLLLSSTLLPQTNNCAWALFMAIFLLSVCCVYPEWGCKQSFWVLRVFRSFVVNLSHDSCVHSTYNE